MNSMICAANAICYIFSISIQIKKKSHSCYFVKRLLAAVGPNVRHFPHTTILLAFS